MFSLGPFMHMALHVMTNPLIVNWLAQKWLPNSEMYRNPRSKRIKEHVHIKLWSCSKSYMLEHAYSSIKSSTHKPRNRTKIEWWSMPPNQITLVFNYSWTQIRDPFVHGTFQKYKNRSKGSRKQKSYLIIAGRGKRLRNSWTETSEEATVIRRWKRAK